MSNNTEALTSEDLVCPECGGTLSLDSSVSMQVSILSCDDCSNFRMQRSCDEESLIEKFISEHPKCVKEASND